MRGKPLTGGDSFAIPPQAGVATTIDTRATRSAATHLLSNGFSVIPAKNKVPQGAWKPYQTERMDVSQVDAVIRNHPQIAIVCGAVSGNLEVIDVDSKHDTSGTLLADLSHLISSHDEELWNSLVMQRTVSGGMHILYRCDTIQGNRKLAKCAATGNVLVETRGEGGIIIAAPSEGYRLAPKHDFAQVPRITPQQRELILAACRSFNQVPDKPESPAPRHDPAEWHQPPGDAYDAQADVPALLESHGWTVTARRSGGRVWLKRPGDSDSPHSATWNVIPGRFWCWSTSTPFTAETPYKPYAVYAVLEHGGDFSAAARTLHAKGFGQRAQPAGEEPAAPSGPAGTDLKQARKWLLDGQLGIAHLFAHLKENEYVFDHTYREWRRYKAGTWRLDTEKKLLGKLASIIRPVVAKVQTSLDRKLMDAQTEADKKKAEAEHKAVTAAGRSLNQAGNVKSCLEFSSSILSTTSDKLDNNPLLFNLANGTYDFGTGSFGPHDPKHFLSLASPHSYREGAECPAWTEFLHTVFMGDADLTAFVRRAAGYSLTGLSDLQGLFFCHGGGGNGKSVFFSVLADLMGQYYTSIPIDLLLSREKSNSTDEYQRAAIKGTRCVVASEIPAGKRMNESQVKDMTGGDTINARVPHGMPFTFKPSHTLWMFGNHKPVITGTDMGIWRRIHLIPFLYSIPPEKKRDMNVMMKQFRSEMPGIFNWAAEGYAEYTRIGLAAPASVTEATAEYKADSNSLNRFLDERCQRVSVGSVLSKVLYQNYAAWCESEGERPSVKNSREMNNFLRQAGFTCEYNSHKETTAFGLMLIP